MTTQQLQFKPLLCRINGFGIGLDRVTVGG